MFLVFEGMDGSGKTTQMFLVAKHYFDQRRDVLLTREPSNGPYGTKIRQAYLTKKDPMSHAEELLDLFVKDREWHVENKITPALREGYVVLSDRYYHSTIAYQTTQGIDMQRTIERNERFLKPDKTFIFDLSPKLALDRTGIRPGREKFEDLEFMKRLRQNFLKLTDVLDENISVIDASLDVDVVSEAVLRELPKLE